MRRLQIAFLFTALFSVFGFSQEKEHQLYLKANTLFLPVAVINAGAEYQLSPKYTLQADFFISPWKSFAGKHAQIYMGHVEGRYYFKEAFDGWYLGVNGGAGVFDITKWNYPDTHFQRGFGFMIGATGGYQFQIRERWNLDAFLGVGSVQSFYHGYEHVPPEFIRYEFDGRKWNRSGEFLPYRGGLMLSYKIK